MSDTTKPDAPDDEVEIDFSEVDPNFTYEQAEEESRKLSEERLGFEHERRLTEPTPGMVGMFKRYVRTPTDLMNMPPPDWFIEDLIPAGPVTILHGESGCKKSFVLLDWFLCAAKGIGWHGKDIAKGKTLYIVGEGLSGMGKRVRAWADAHDTDMASLTNDISFVKQPINLFSLDAVQVGHWADLIAYLNYRYVVVDTLHTNSGGADENSSKDMGRVFSTAKQIAGDAQLIFAHHDPKAKGANSARGSGSIRDDADVVISLVKTGPLSSTLQSEKLKDAEDFRPVAIEFAISGQGSGSSLYVDSIASGNAVDLPKPKTAAEKCVDAIIEYQLDPNLGRVALKAELDILQFKFGEATVGTAIRHLKRSEHEADILARRATAGNTEPYKDPS